MKSVSFTKVPELDYASSEAINTLSINVTFSSENVSRIMVTSCREHEGKSFISFFLAKKLSEMGYRTVLVDGDLRRSVMNGRYGVTMREGSRGLTHYLSRTMPLDEVLYGTNIANLYYIPIGHDVVNSVSLLNSARFFDMMKTLKSLYDYIIVDTPPIGAIVDAAAVARVCDGALMVFTPNVIDRRELLSAKEQIAKSGCPILGGVMNKVVMTKTSSRYYYRSKYAAYKTKHYYRSNNEKS